LSKEYASPLTLEFQQSHVVWFYLSVVHILAAIALLLSTVVIFFKVIVSMLLLVSFLYQKIKLSRYKELVWLADNDWLLIDATGNESNVHLTSLSFSSSWLVILALRNENNKAINLVLPFDALTKESFRRLKVKLTILKPDALKPLGEDD